MADRDQLLAFEFTERLDHVFVDRVGEIHHLQAARLEGLDIGAALELGAARADEVVDLVLAVLRAGQVVGEAGELAVLGHRRFEAQQLRQRLAVRVIHRHAFLEEAVELLVEGLEFLRIGLRLLLEHLDHPLADHAAELPHQRAVLHGLAGNVQRDVGAIDHSLHEAHPIRQQALRRGIDQHLLAVERDRRLGLVHADPLHVLVGHEDQRVDRDRRVGGEMQAVGRVVVGVAGEFVEGLVLLLGDVRLVLQPQRLDLVDALAVEDDREADEVAVALDQVLHPRLVGVFLVLFLQLEHDLHAALQPAAFVDRVAAGAIAGPDQLLAVLTPAAGVDLDFGGDHEGRVEADTELADHVGRRVAAVLHRGQERLGSGVGDGAEILDQLAAGHADAVVGDRQGLRLLVGGDVDLQRQLGIVDVLFRALEVAEFLHRVRRVRDQLAQENLAVGVEGMDDQIEQLLDLRLEGMRFEGGFAHENGNGVGAAKIAGNSPLSKGERGSEFPDRNGWDRSLWGFADGSDNANQPRMNGMNADQKNPGWSGIRLSSAFIPFICG